MQNSDNTPIVTTLWVGAYGWHIIAQQAPCKSFDFQIIGTFVPSNQSAERPEIPGIKAWWDSDDVMTGYCEQATVGGIPGEWWVDTDDVINSPEHWREYADGQTKLLNDWLDGKHWEIVLMHDDIVIKTVTGYTESPDTNDALTTFLSILSTK